MPGALTRPLRTAVLVLTGALLPGAAAAAAETLSTQLRELAREHGFRVQGIGNVGDAPAVDAAGDLRARLRTLLAGYDHVVEGAPEVTRVIILGASADAPSAFVVETTRQQRHHLVTATLRGPGGRRAELSMLVDTGASSLVLPDSMMGDLGFEPGALPERSSRTVNGTIKGRAGRLDSVTVGGAVAWDVDVLFVPAERLGGMSLLGMSFLGRFALTIDEAGGRLTLAPR